MRIFTTNLHSNYHETKILFKLKKINKENHKIKKSNINLRVEQFTKVFLR